MSAQTETETETVSLRQGAGFEFDVRFGPSLPALRADLPPPTGGGNGATPEQLLAAAVGNCLSASLLFALRKFKQSPDPISTDVDAEVGRNPEGRMRVLGLRARIALGVPAERLENLQRVLDTFETYCTVTQSVRAGIPVTVEVVDSLGARLK
jgi:organic hydroperoxide reductase OsmC/OhrA